MIKEFIDLWEENKAELEGYFKTTVQSEYDDYADLVRLVVEKIINKREEDYIENKYDIGKMTIIDHGDYQGTILFIIPEDIYQPSNYEYIYTSVGYGSCSGCDTLQSISGYDDELPNEQQVSDYMTLCLHLIQKFKRMGE